METDSRCARTWKEITAQPRIWRDWSAEFEFGEVRDWLSGLAVEETWFCGAGLSAHIGAILCAGLEGQGGRFRSVATTDLVSRPRAHLSARAPLVVHFGRSGGSPETLGALDALDALAPAAPRLNVTCNAAGALARRKATGPCGVILLPEAARDHGPVMSVSLSTMLLTALLLFDTAPPEGALPRVAQGLEDMLPRLSALAEETEAPGRLLFLGTGPMASVARAAALSVMAMTGGAVAAIGESTLGLRHGTAAFIDGDTRIVMFTSGEARAARYEADLLDELSAAFPEAGLATLGPRAEFDAGLDLPDAWQAPLALALAQVLGATWARRGTARPKRESRPPGRGGVRGATLYPVSAAEGDPC